MTPAAQQLIEALRLAGRRRADLTTIQKLFAEIEPQFATSTRRRERLAELLDEAAQAGELRLIKSNPDAFAIPWLPHAAIVLGIKRPEPRIFKGGSLWRPELSWASSLRLSPAEHLLLRQIEGFLRDLRPEEPILTIRERSLEITGDEKKLESYVHSRLFGPGRLTLNLLRCEEVHPPFVWQQVGTAPTALVIENHQTFHSLGKVLVDSREIGFLVYGAGNHFVGSVTYVSCLPEPPVEELYYFGDVDVEGLLIPFRASAVSVAAGLPPVEASRGLYRALLEIGTPAGGQTVTPALVRRAAQWLPEQLQEQASALLISGRRLAQEALNFRRLSAMKASGELVLI